MAARVLALLAAVLFAAACATPKSPRCQKVCDREARCSARAQDDQVTFDESECVEVCTSLDRTPEGERLVDEHVACVNAAKTCTAVRRCSQ